LLYVVSTPIGNLKDITLRAIETLKSCKFVLCEDTRVSSHLLREYEITTPLISFNAHSEDKKIPYLLERMLNGEDAALITDAGTPAISDPGIRLVSAALDAGIKVTPVPGASALLSALVVAGFPTDSFVFEGFLPQKKGRQKLLKELSTEKRTIVLYESPYRILKLLEELKEYMPTRRIAVVREITKKFEETVRGLPEELFNYFTTNTLKGEFVIVLDSLSNKQQQDEI